MYSKCHLHTENSVEGTTLLEVITGRFNALVSDISDLALKHKQATERFCSYVMQGIEPQYSICPFVKGNKKRKKEKKTQQ